MALLGSKDALASLRRCIALSGREVVLELDPVIPNGDSDNRPGSLTMLASGDREEIDELVVLRAADAFASVEDLLAGLRRLDALGIRFESLEEPWLTLRGSVAREDSMGALTAALEGRAAHFLDLSIERLEEDSRASLEQARRKAMQGEVGKVLAQLLLLVPYAVAVGIVSQAMLNAAILDPDLLLRRVRDLVGGSAAVTGTVTGAIPDALRGVFFSAISALILLVFRGTSIGLRAELGGALFMGLVTLSVYGLSAGFGTGIIGALVAMPGLVLAVVVTVEFTHMVLRITSTTGAAEAMPATSPGLVERLHRRLGEFDDRVRPTGSTARAAAFVAIPLLAVLVSLAATLTHGGGLFWPARIALFALVGWSAWACLATPGSVRIPLWSMLGWATLLLLLSAATVVTAVFAVFIVLLLAGIVFELVFRHVGADAAATVLA